VPAASDWVGYGVYINDYCGDTDPPTPDYLAQLYIVIS
jgi:hypothetical protein